MQTPAMGLGDAGSFGTPVGTPESTPPPSGSSLRSPRLDRSPPRASPKPPAQPSFHDGVQSPASYLRWRAPTPDSGNASSAPEASAAQQDPPCSLGSAGASAVDAAAQQQLRAR